MEMEIAEDLIFRVLLWLPVTTLFRFKSVCRSWRSFIESPTFVSQHLHHHHHHLDDQVDSWKLMVLDPWVISRLQGPADLEFCLLSGKNFQFLHKLPFHLSSQQTQGRYCSAESNPEIIASLHGIICLHLGFDTSKAKIDNFYYPDISLWNPATTESFILPKPPVPIPYNHIKFRFNYGFGFDFETNDYKVVRVLIEEDHNFNHLHLASRFPNSRTDVYCLSTNSWRKVDAVLPVHTIACNPKVPFRGGIYCWLGWHQYRVNGEVAVGNVIFSFDFTTEVFGTIPVPDVYHQNINNRPELSYLRENIACIGHDSSLPQYHIWVLNQYGVNDSWTKLYTIRRIEYPGHLCGISKNGKLFWCGINYTWPNTRRTLYLSDLVTQDLEILPVDPNPPSPATQAVVYKESLVSIKSAVGASAIKSAICSGKPPSDKKKMKGCQRKRVKLYVRGTILGYKRSKSSQYPNTSLVQIEGVNTKEEVAWYCGKKMAYIYKAKVEKNGSHYRCIWGKVTRPHGNNGVVRAKFKSILPPTAIGMKVRVFMYPSNI